MDSSMKWDDASEWVGVIDSAMKWDAGEWVIDDRGNRCSVIYWRSKGRADMQRLADQEAL